MIDHLPILVIVVPLMYGFCAAILKYFSVRAARVGFVSASSVQLALVAALARQVALQGTVEYRLAAWHPEVGIVLVVDVLAVLFAAIIAFCVLLVAVYSADYPAADSTSYFTLASILTAGMTGIVLTGDLFNLYVFIEMTSLSSVALVAVNRDEKGIRAALRYIVFSIVAGLLFLLAVMLLYGASGSLNMRIVAGQFAGFAPNLQAVVIALFAVALGIKTAVIPFHGWLPDVYTGSPSAVSALLSGAVNKTGIYMLARLLFTLTSPGSHGVLQPALLAAGAVTILGGHTLALGQTNVKSILACSSIAHTGYMVMGFGVGTAAGVTAGLFHALNHMVMKSGAFLSAEAMSTKGQDIQQWQGLQKRVSTAGVVFVVSTLALVGIPPFGAFMSKWQLATAAIQEGLWHAALFVPLGTAMAVLYYGRVYRSLFSLRCEESTADTDMQHLTTVRKLVLAAAAVGCVAPFLLHGGLLSVLRAAALNLF